MGKKKLSTFFFTDVQKICVRKCQETVRKQSGRGWVALMGGPECGASVSGMTIVRIWNDDSAYLE
ncbi:hypothetical protein EBS43_09735 [bacterium]|nr:hypothetical protein [bacterium]